MNEREKKQSSLWESREWKSMKTSPSSRRAGRVREGNRVGSVQFVPRLYAVFQTSFLLIDLSSLFKITHIF